MIGAPGGGAVYLLAALAAAGSVLGPLGTPVKGALLDDVGQFSAALNQLVDGLLERASVLADLVIEAAREEQCEGTCAAGAPKFGPAAANRTGEAPPMKEDAIRATTTSSPDVATATTTSHCKLLGLQLNKRDLPLGSMDACCSSYGACYGQCGYPKLDCDLQFQHCLKSACAASFGPNATAGPASGGPLLESTTSTSLPLAHYDRELDGGSEPPPLEAGHKRDKYRACRLASKVLIIGNLAFGCIEYKRVQQRSCCLSAPPPGNQWPAGGAR